MNRTDVASRSVSVEVQSSPHEQPVLLTFKEAMSFLRVSRSTLYRLMWAGQLRGHKVGSTWRFYRRDLTDAIASPADAETLCRVAATGMQPVEG